MLVMDLVTLGEGEFSENPNGLFIKSMDCAINLLNVDKFQDDTYKTLIDNVLCQAITIAKLSAPTDYHEITSGCKSVNF